MPELSNATIKEQRDAAFRFRGQSITYRQRNDTLNKQSGTITENNTDTIIGTDTEADPGVLLSELDQQAIADSGGKFKVGDKQFRIRHADIPETPPKTTNQIIHGSNTYLIVQYRRSADGNVWDIIGSKA